jgi:acetoin:2,6-dichlorophenolindophenol oxidoreductase subunit beta
MKMFSNKSQLREQARELTYAEALYEATAQEMEIDPSVFVFGLGVDDVKGMYGTTKDLHKRFGALRNFDTPLSEDAMTGVAVGAALAGMRPIHVHQRMDFLLLCMNQLVNVAAKTSYAFGGAFSVPLVVRAIVGRSWGQGAQHSQAFNSYFMNTPGIKVAAPVTPHDVKGCMIAAIRDNNPVVFVEHRMLYGNRGLVPEASYEIPFGKARTITAGNDVTIVAISHMVVEAVRASRLLSEAGISSEIIDPVTLTPIDIDTILSSVRRTGNLLVVDNGWICAGVGSEIVSQVVEQMGGDKSFGVKRMGFAPTPCPTTKPLETLFYPSGSTIAKEAYALVTGDNNWKPEHAEASEITEFRGPF